MIIGLTGPAGSGKTTAAKHLVTSHGFMHLKFAGPLKAMMTALFFGTGVGRETTWRLIEGDLKEHPTPILNGQSPRHAMQTLGTEWGRKCMGEDFWVNVARQRVMLEFEQWPPSLTPRIVFDDVRFENEAAMIRKMGGTVVHLSGRGGIGGSHESEGGVGEGDSDFYLSNRHDVELLHHDADAMVSFLTSE